MSSFGVRMRPPNPISLWELGRRIVDSGTSQPALSLLFGCQIADLDLVLRFWFLFRLRFLVYINASLLIFVVGLVALLHGVSFKLWSARLR